MPFTSLDIPSHDTKAAKLRARSRSNSSAQREGSHDTRHITLHTMKNYDMIHTVHTHIYICVYILIHVIDACLSNASGCICLLIYIYYTFTLYNDVTHCWWVFTRVYNCLLLSSRTFNVPNSLDLLEIGSRLTLAPGTKQTWRSFPFRTFLEAGGRDLWFGTWNAV